MAESRSLRVSLGILFMLLFLMNATSPKGIWADEVLHFAWGSFTDTPTAVEMIFRSVGEKMNHGQTGIYMVLNHLALKHFGASYMALRFPSYIAFGLSLLAGYAFLRSLGCSLLVRLAFLLALAFCQLNREHGWEARPYIVLQASVMGFLWAWERFFRRAGHSLAAIFFVSVAGVLFHPFFVAYAGLIVIGSFAFFPSRRAFLLSEISTPSRAMRIFALTAFLAGLFLLIGRLSWFNSLHKSFGLDPYQYVGHDKSLPRFMLGTFFYPFSIFVVPFLGVLTLFLTWRRKNPAAAPLFEHALLLAVVVAISQGLIVRSVIQSQYWILQRQWVAAGALALLFAALLLEGALRLLMLKPSLLNLAGKLVLGAGILVAGWRIEKNLRVPFPPSVPVSQTEAYLARFAEKKDLQMSDLQSLAHQNLMTGGPVWPVFRQIYSFDPLP